ncbi:hypothetical protein [Mycobacterium ostraviense]|uniref:Uncharacterized protein n=1 Tax=Mycobacterium ostraviense TaxID=2738409 RepID=A0A163YAY7_9MYCO|nr:hypothetical protein [Mycobacterium ostraviense]KZS60259.1 hypothetical protein A4G28_14380 [Mycobacterium ostraviense]UGT91271.1 hypothetical protein LTS72_24305 [Mycobacterium ostraviense]
MTTMTTNFAVPQRFTQVTKGRGRSLLRAGRRLSGTLSASFTMTPQQRADAYLARMPVAVITDLH